MEQVKKAEMVQEQVAEAQEVKKEKKPVKLQTLRAMLAEETGYTISELAEGSGVKESTVKCQIYFHLKNAGLPCKKLEGKKYRFMTPDEVEEYLDNMD